MTHKYDVGIYTVITFDRENRKLNEFPLRVGANEARCFGEQQISEGNCWSYTVMYCAINSQHKHQKEVHWPECVK